MLLTFKSEVRVDGFYTSFDQTFLLKGLENFPCQIFFNRVVKLFFKLIDSDAGYFYAFQF